MIFNQLTSYVEDVLKSYILNEILLVATSINFYSLWSRQIKFRQHISFHFQSRQYLHIQTISTHLDNYISSTHELLIEAFLFQSEWQLSILQVNTTSRVRFVYRWVLLLELGYFVCLYMLGLGFPDSVTGTFLYCLFTISEVSVAVFLILSKKKKINRFLLLTV